MAILAGGIAIGVSRSSAPPAAPRHADGAGSAAVGSASPGVAQAQAASTSPTTVPSTLHASTTPGTQDRVIVAPQTAQETYPATTLVATLHEPVPKYARPGGPRTGVVPGSWYGAPSKLPILQQDAGFLQVRLAQRPNEATAWIPASDATITSSPYRIVIKLSTTHLMLYKGNTMILDAPAGVGTVQDPTPTGEYFVAFFARSPSPGYGPFVVVTSAHSNAISDWEQSGDAVVAIHGPLGADGLIGTTGARVSHGCVRLHLNDLAPLRQVPPGSPIEIVQ
jgi:lipoprotein-anchoring transpeptidase ErfK/SrfK